MKQCVDRQPCTRHYTPCFADHPGLMQFSYSQTSRYVIVTLDVSHAGSAPLSEVRFIRVHISTQSDKFAVYADARKWPNSSCMYTSRVFNQNDHLDMHRVVQTSRQSRRRRRFTSSPLFAARQRFLRLNFDTDVTGNDFKSSNGSL